MKRKNGFAISGVLYPILILVVFLIVQLLTMLGTRKAVLDQNSKKLLETINSENKIYTNEEISTIITDLQTQIQTLKTENINLQNELDKYTLLTTHQSLNNFVKERFPGYLQSSTDYTYSCGTRNSRNSSGMRQFLQDSWTSFKDGISIRQLNSYGCVYMAIINKSVGDYGTIILTGYSSDGTEALIVGNIASGKFYWSITNMTDL